MLIERAYLDIDAAQIEVREDENGTPVVSGYAIVYDAVSRDLGGFKEIVRRGAVDEALKGKPDVLCRVQHQGGTSVIGRTKNGTLRLWSDTRGLRYECSPADTQQGRDIVTLIRRKDIDASSFAFSLGDLELDQRWDFNQAPPLRELLRINLHDVAPVDVGAYPAASVGLRAEALAFLESALAKRAAESPAAAAQLDTLYAALRQEADAAELDTLLSTFPTA